MAVDRVLRERSHASRTSTSAGAAHEGSPAKRSFRLRYKLRAAAPPAASAICTIPRISSPRRIASTAGSRPLTYSLNENDAGTSTAINSRISLDSPNRCRKVETFNKSPVRLYLRLIGSPKLFSAAPAGSPIRVALVCCAECLSPGENVQFLPRGMVLAPILARYIW